MIFGVVINKLLDRACAVRAFFAQCGERDKVKTEALAHNIRGNFALCEGVIRKVPKRLFATTRFVDSRITFLLIMNINEKGVVRTKHELTFKFKIAVSEDLL